MGCLTDMAYLADHGRGYAVMINSGNGKALFKITNLIRSYVIRDLPAPALPPAASVPIELQRHFDGYYQLNRKICLQPSAFPRGLRKRAPFGFRRRVREGLLPRRSR